MYFLGLHIINSKYQDFLEIIKNPEKKALVFTPNPEILVRASRDVDFLEILKQADYLTPDGAGLYVGAMMAEGKGFISAGFETFFHRSQLEAKYGELISGSNLTRDLVDIAIREKKKILMIDNYRITHPQNDFEKKKMIIQGKLSELFAMRFPDLRAMIDFDGEKSPEEIARLIEGDDISYVFSCIGMKSQEKRLVEIFSYLPETMKVVGLGVGSSFDYLLGLQQRAPLIFQKLGLEWFYRLMLEPRKRWRRIYTAVVEFPRMMKSSQD